MGADTRPLAVLVVGPPGAGKTTARLEIRALFDAPGRRWSVLYSEGVQRGLSIGPEQYRPHIRALGRRVLDAARGAAIGARLDVLVEACAATRAERAALLEPFRAAGYETAIVELLEDETTCTARAQRDPGRMATAPHVWPPMVRRYVERYEPPVPDEADRVIVREPSAWRAVC